VLTFTAGSYHNRSVGNINGLTVAGKLVELHSPVIDLNFRELGGEFVLTLCTAIGRVGCVRVLELGENKLDDSAIPGIIESVISNPNMSLQILDLGGNEITDEGAQLLKTAITNHRHLTKVILTGNKISANVLIEIAQTICQNSANLASVSDRTQPNFLTRQRIP
jgi:hypothetical protein